MRIEKRNGGYVMWLSKNDTYDWAHRSGASWPCSTLSNHRIMVVVDCNGLCDFTIDGRDDDGNVDGCELDACVGDHLPADCRKFWPTWSVPQERALA